MDGQMRAVQTNEQQMEQTEPRVDAERPPKKSPGWAIPMFPVSQSLSFQSRAFTSHDTSGGKSLNGAAFSSTIVVGFLEHDLFRLS
jgi:hypothetical protein